MLFQKRGFTLIELLVVMAIIGVLAVIVFAGINPSERQAQARDTGRISAVAQIGRSLQGYYTSLGSYPATGNWAQDVVDNGQFSTFPSGIAYVVSGISACTTFAQPDPDFTYCYDTSLANGSIVFSVAESLSHRDRCTVGQAYFVFSTADGRGGTICSSGDPSPWASGTQTYVN